MRLKDRDYSASGFYFVTICATQTRFIFGQINQKSVELTALGHIARETWIGIPLHFAQVNLHSFVVMPNHVHGIIEIASTGLAQRAAPLQARQQGVQSGSLSAIVRSFKGEVTRRGREELHWRGRVWQPNYFDRVIRDGKEYSNACRYISENPLRWESDLENPNVAGARRKEGLAQHAARLQRTPRIE